MINVEEVYLPVKPLNNFELEQAAQDLNISNFRGVCLRDLLPKKTNKNECGILNLDDSDGSGTHWVAWYKKGKHKYYFDSYGVQPPLELRSYFKSPIYYSTEKIQRPEQVVCGHLCLYMLKKLSDGYHPQDVINSLI